MNLECFAFYMMIIHSRSHIYGFCVHCVFQRYKSIHGHCNVPQKYILNPRLGRWLAQQRISMRKAKCESKPGSKGGKAMLERVHRLKEIGVFPSIGTSIGLN